MANLRTKWCGLEMRNPIGVAAIHMQQPPALRAENVADRLMLWVEKGAGLVSTGYIGTETSDKYPSGWEPTGRWGLWNEPFAKALVGSGSAAHNVGRIDEGLKLVRILKERCPEGVIVQANIVVAGADPVRWAEHAKAFQEAGADVIEMDVSCPLTVFYPTGAFSVEWMKGMPPNMLADMPEQLAEVIKEVTRRVTIPVGWKASAETGYPRCIYAAKATYEAGAKFVSCTNGAITISPVDIYNRGKPLESALPFIGRNRPIGLVGGISRFLGTKSVAYVKYFVPEMEVVGITGITSANHVVEYIMLGAQIVELSSAIYWYGADVIARYIKFLEKFMEGQGYESIDDFRGLALKELELDSSKVDWRLGQLVALVDTTKCNGCGICANTICLACYMEEGLAKVREEDCSGCGQCVCICPTRAFTVVERQKPREVKV